jgi:hypothetical protein
MLYSIHQDNLYYGNRHINIDKQKGKKNIEQTFFPVYGFMFWFASCFLSFVVGYKLTDHSCNCRTILNDIDL